MCLCVTVTAAQELEVPQFIPIIAVVTNKAGDDCPPEDRQLLRALLADRFNSALGITPGSAYVLDFQAEVVSVCRRAEGSNQGQQWL